MTRACPVASDDAPQPQAHEQGGSLPGNDLCGLADVDGPVFPGEGPAGELTCSMLVPIAIDDNPAVLFQHGLIIPGVGVAVFPVVQWRETVAALRRRAGFAGDGHADFLLSLAAAAARRLAAAAVPRLSGGAGNRTPVPRCFHAGVYVHSRSTSAIRSSRPRVGRVRESLASWFSPGSLASAEAVPNCGRQSGLSGEDPQPGRRLGRHCKARLGN